MPGVLIPLLLLAGCGQGKEQAKEQNPEELLKEAISSQKQLKSGKLQLTMNFKAAVPLEEAQDLLGDVQNSAIQMDMDADMQFQEERMRMDGELNMQLMSMNIPVPIESYTVKNDDKYVTYTKTGKSGRSLRRMYPAAIWERWYLPDRSCTREFRKIPCL